jgi:hypothetical protein
LPSFHILVHPDRDQSYLTFISYSFFDRYRAWGPSSPLLLFCPRSLSAVMVSFNESPFSWLLSGLMWRGTRNSLAPYVNTDILVSQGRCNNSDSTIHH